MIRNYWCFKQITKYLTNKMGGTYKIMFATKKQQYIPIRPLKDQQNLIYRIQNPSKLSIVNRIIIFTPFLAFSLQGIINQWGPLVIGGGFISLILGLKILNALKYVRSHEIIEMNVDPKVSKFYVKLISNSFTKQIENEILKSKKTNYLQFFKKQLKEDKIGLSEGTRENLLSLSEKKLQIRIKMMRALSDSVYIEINKQQIQRIEMITQRQLWQKMRENHQKGSRWKKIREIFQVYTTDKKKKKILALSVKSINDNFKYTVFMNLDLNIQKKYEEYLQAIGEGKTIVNPMK